MKISLFFENNSFVSSLICLIQIEFTITRKRKLLFYVCFWTDHNKYNTHACVRTINCASIPFEKKNQIFIEKKTVRNLHHYQRFLWLAIAKLISWSLLFAVQLLSMFRWCLWLRPTKSTVNSCRRQILHTLLHASLIDWLKNLYEWKENVWR